MNEVLTMFKKSFHCQWCNIANRHYLSFSLHTWILLYSTLIKDEEGKLSGTS